MINQIPVLSETFRVPDSSVLSVGNPFDVLFVDPLIPVDTGFVMLVEQVATSEPIEVIAQDVTKPTNVDAFPVRTVVNGSAAGFNFVQVTPSTTWNVPHNLGYYPEVSVRIGAIEIDGQVTHLSVNTLRLDFVDEIAGSVRCI